MRAILITLTILLLAQPVWANNGFKPSESTFFTDGKLDRIYFDNDGVFYQQLSTNWDNIDAGQLLKGNWELNDQTQELCLDYTVPEYPKLCFDAVKNFEGNGYSLFDKSGNIHFNWKVIKQGNWLLSVEGMAYLQQAFAYQTLSDNVDNDIEKYLSDKILIGIEGPLGRMRAYFKPSNEGAYINVQDGSVEPMAWMVENGYVRTNSTISDAADQFIMTLGQEFLEDRPPMAIYYDIDGVSPQGEGFTLKPAINHENLDLFKQ